MTKLLGFKLDFWDFATFAVLVMSVAVFLTFLVWMAGLPGRIAIARKHPEAEAVRIMGYLGFLPLVPWIQAFIWAFKPTNVVDIRNFPAAEARHIHEMIAHLSGASATPPAKPTETTPPPAEPPKGDKDK
jgi:hypothetical protein